MLVFPNILFNKLHLFLTVRPPKNIKVDESCWIIIIKLKRLTIVLYVSYANCGRHITSIHFRPKNFPCEFCDERFSGKNEKYAHIKRVHPFPFGSRLYRKPTNWQLVECKLCNKTFSTTKDLSNHLLQHSSIDTLDNLDINSQIVQHLFANTNDLNTIKESICRDINEKQWFKYYNILNESSLEMSITDTEVEDLEDDAIQSNSKYKCEVCNQQFSFKFQTFAHLKATHGE